MWETERAGGAVRLGDVELDKSMVLGLCFEFVCDMGLVMNSELYFFSFFSSYLLAVFQTVVKKFLVFA